ncbi:MAG: NADH-quinone oxidoreductase subunit C/D [Pseudomonadales bacterium]|jgi:NADH-quinone oxidoreductase subunit C/D|nr:NADH-quinone oxidoreductase subunit C/D [Pseudomonadales bacterium]MDP7359247.1 NADH-quinone oxidoreductase subunit C/D [Pseudomonadales bacterium]MDP7596422.1 NADH-quinone oxidoreductase subunit C/D [Pseudomonadales bacterium]HJN50153.1 NADH-quinone oxidoreductase subunit C/D [Pseudomonadales bacterium]|tara:strand:- start:223 stop:1998 length:1776 start_codon:yes stop_codon:yes gene_type:complete
MNTAQTAVNQLDKPAIARELENRFADVTLIYQPTIDALPTFWVGRDRFRDVLKYLKTESVQPYPMLYDLCGMDERVRTHREGLPNSDFTVIYHLLSIVRNEDIRIKVALTENDNTVPTVSDIFPNANWYEREAWDMFGITFDGHPNLRRILTPPWWEGHPLRKDHPARATEMEPFTLTEEKQEQYQEALRFKPEEWGMSRKKGDTEYMFLNIGPNHPSSHGAFRIVLQLDGEVVVDAVPEIGFHHRGAEKMGERQSWHSFIPYTDRIDYAAGVMNNLPYVMAVEKLAGIEVPDRVKVIRIMLVELFRVISHMVFWGTFSADVGHMSSIFYMFNDRERIFRIFEAITGGRMHPSWFRIGGVAQDLPNGWDKMVRDFVEWMPGRVDHFDKISMQNTVLQKRTVGIGIYTQEEALDWGVTGPGLRATGIDYDFRRDRAYGGYDQFDFDIPVGSNGDCYDRAAVRVEEVRQSVRIVKQCLDNMPEGPYKADHPLTTPPPKERTMRDIETLIHHFVNVSWGPVIPAGEASVTVEATKGNNSYYLTSDGSTTSYRTRIRTPTFAHLQMLPLISRGLMVQDVVAILCATDIVMADVDR